MTYRRIVVPLDGSDLGVRAIGSAARLARLLTVGLDLVTVATADEAAEAALMLDAAKRGWPQPEVDVAIEVLVGTDVPGEIARHASRCAGLVCTSSRGRGSLGRALLGSVARDVVRRVRTGVVVVGPRCDTERLDAIDRLVACIDGTARGERAVDVTARWSGTTGLPILVAHVVYPLVDPKARIPPTERELRSLAHAEHVAKRLQASGRIALPVTIQDADVNRAISRLAERFPSALLVVATAEEEGVAGLVAGSTAAAVVSQSTTPVLLVRQQEET